MKKLYFIYTLIKSYLLKNTYDFHHFDYELFEQNPHKWISQAIEFVWMTEVTTANIMLFIANRGIWEDIVDSNNDNWMRWCIVILTYDSASAWTY